MKLLTEFSGIIVGDVVRVKKESDSLTANMLGVVYERYRFGSCEAVSIIFENGVCDGWAEKEFGLFLGKIMHSTELETYPFRNVRQLRSDFLRGVFTGAFSMAANPVGTSEESMLW